MGAHLPPMPQGVTLDGSRITAREIGVLQQQLPAEAIVRTQIPPQAFPVAQLRALNALFAARQDLLLSIRPHDALDFTNLRHLPDLARAELESWHAFENMEALADLNRLRELHLRFNGTKSIAALSLVQSELETLSVHSYGKKCVLDLSPIARFVRLKNLSIGGFDKNLPETVAMLSELELLALRSISKPKNADFIAGLHRLKRLVLQRCPFENLDGIARLARLKYLQLWNLPRLGSLKAIAALPELQYLFIETLNSLTAFPDVSSAAKLRRIQISSCKNLRDFSALRHCAPLRDFYVMNATQAPEVFLPVFTHPNVRSLQIDYGKAGKDKAARELAAQYGKVFETFYPRMADIEFEFD